MRYVVISYYMYVGFSILSNILYFFYKELAEVFLGLSSISFLIFLYVIGLKIKRELKINVLSIYYIVLSLVIFSFFPLYLTSSIFTYFFSQTLALLFVLLYLKLILSVLKSRLSIFNLILFSILTFGIYSYVFFYKLIKEIEKSLT
ncbi:MULTISPECIES: DUF4234 domain-containing protein [Thermosipho]|uniref:DUF4234 domain-containing protein n=1 Tax=Thermosipho TaxID=2420 RepID=UPI001E4C752F|nr:MULTISPECIES: DUF4234 domain-containing protein [Thermosipho]